MKLITQFPCLDEATTPPIALTALPSEVPGFDTVEWLVIDGGGDDTVDVARAHGVDYIVCHIRNKGLAHALTTSIVARGSNFPTTAVELARTNATARGRQSDGFYAQSIYSLEVERDGADIIVCCEVMEHLGHPEKALTKLREVVRGVMIQSVPREPLWREINRC